MMRLACGALLFTTALSSANAQGAAESRADSSAGSKSECKGNFLSRAMCKGATKITQAALSAGVITPPKMGSIAPPPLPIFGTYRVQLRQEGSDSLTFFVRTITPLDTRVPDGEWIGYGTRFVSAMSERDLPTSLESPEARSQSKVGGGPMLFLTSSKDSTRFAVSLPLMLPMLHPTILAARGTWLEEAIKSAPPMKGWSPKEYERAANGTMGSSMIPSTFEVTWKSRDRRFAMRAQLVSEIGFVTGPLK